MTGHDASRVAPFGNPRIFVYLRLPEASRRLLRPSSALNAKAFTVRSFSFYLLVCVIKKTVLSLFNLMKSYQPEEKT